MKDRDWPNWISAYDSECRPYPGHRNKNYDAWSLCCSEAPLCSFCASCGGEWGYESSSISSDRDWPNFFEIRGKECSGDLKS